jgi:hypothetical protein
VASSDSELPETTPRLVIGLTTYSEQAQMLFWSDRITARTSGQRLDRFDDNVEVA